MDKKTTILLTICILLSSVTRSHGAIEIETITERTTDGDTKGYIIKSLLQGLNSSLTFHSTNDTEAAGDVYFLSFDGGKTTHYVDTKENTCYQWSNSELGQTLSKFMLKTSDKFNIKISDIQHQKIFEKTAEPILGYAVQHVRMELNFNASYKYLLFKDKFKVERTANFWVIPADENIKATPFYQTLWQYTGDAKFNEQIQSMVGTDNQFLLRSEIVQNMTDKKKKKTSTEIVQYVKTIKEVNDVSPDRFVLPDCEAIGPKKMEKEFKALLKSLIGD